MSTTTTSTTSTTPPTTTLIPPDRPRLGGYLNEGSEVQDAQLLASCTDVSIPLTCYDNMVITLWGEHYVSLKLLNGILDKDCPPEFPAILRQIRRHAVGIWGESHRTVDSHPVFHTWQSDYPAECFNVNLDMVDVCTTKALTSNGRIRKSYLRELRHVSSAARRERQKHRQILSTCMSTGK